MYRRYKELREEKGKSQKEIAHIIGLLHQTTKP